MRTSNLANEALRHAEVGQVWEEVLTNSAGTISVPPFSTFRVRAAAAVTVTIDGTLAATMISGEILVFNAGSGQPGAAPGDQNATQCQVAVTGNCFLQTARVNVRKN